MINNSTKPSGTKVLQTPEYSVTNFSHSVDPSCLDTKKQDPSNAVKFFKENAAKNLRKLLEKISDLSKNIFEKKTRQSSKNYAINFEKFVESLRLYTTNLFDLLNNTRFLKGMVTIHGRKIWL